MIINFYNKIIKFLNEIILLNIKDKKQIFSQYLERYLWLNFDPEKSTKEHIMSIVVMINEKYRERISAWQVIFFVLFFCVIKRANLANFDNFLYKIFLAYVKVACSG